MSTELLPLDRSDFVPIGTGLPAPQQDAETPRWCFSFLTIDTRDKEIGRPTIKMATPTLIRRWPYIRRDDDVDPMKIPAPPMLVQDYNYPGPAFEELSQRYAEWGLTELTCLRGMETKADIDFIIKLTSHVMPHPFLFDNPEDPDQDLFKRRASWLDARRKDFNEGTKEELFCKALVAANRQTQKYMSEWWAKFFHDAQRAKTPGSGQVGRTALYDGEDLMLKWCGLKPSKFFDGYEDATVASGPAQLTLPPEMLEFFTAVTRSKDEKIESLETALSMMGDQLAQINASLQAAAAKESKGGKPPQGA